LLRLPGPLLWLSGPLLWLAERPLPDELLLPDELPVEELPFRLDGPLLRLPGVARLRCWVAAAPRDGVDLPPTVFFRPRVDDCFINQ
jgi:hypothetical protein